MANPFDQFDTVGSNAFDQFDEAPAVTPIVPKVETAKEQPKTLFGNAVIPALMESLTRSEPSVAEPGFMGAAKDVALGVPEAIAGLTSGLGAFIGGQVASVPTALTAMLPQGEKDKFDVTRGLAEGQKVAEKISTAGTYHPTTDTGKLLMKPIDVVFGTLLGSVENTVRQLADPTVSKEEVDKRVQASHYVTNSLLLGLPLLKGKLEKGKPLTMEDFKEAEKSIPAETPSDIASATLDALRNFNIKEAVASNVKTKFEGNQSIAEGLMTEALKREGHAKGALNRVAKIVSDLEGDVSGVDFKGMRGVGPKSKALIDKLVKERDSITEPKIEKTIVLPETGKKLEPTGTGILTSEMDTPGVELDRFEQSIPAGDQAIMADVFKNIRDNKLHEKGSFPQQLFNMVGWIYENRTGKKLEILGGVNKPEVTLPNKLSEAVDKPNQVKTLEQMGVTEPSAQVDAIVRDAVTQKLDLANGLDKRGKVEAADKVRQEGLDNAKKLTLADGPVTEALVQKVVNEKVAKPYPAISNDTKPLVTEISLKDGAKVKLEYSKSQFIKDDNVKALGGEVIAYSKDGVKIGELYVELGEGPDFTIADVNVEAPFKRKGVATAMHNLVESIEGRKLENPPIQSTEARFFYTNRNIFNSTLPFPELPKVEESRIISEFDNTSLAKGEGYEIKDKRRFDSIDSAQKVARHKGEGNEVIKIGDKYAVGKFVETEIPEYPSMEALKADLEVMSEIPYSKAKIEAEQPEGSEFWVAKVGDKYYRTVVKDPNAPVRPNVDFIPEEVKGAEPEIEPTVEALQVEEVQLRKDLKALVKENKKVDAPKEAIRPEIAEAFKKYKERYVEKINVASPKELPVIDSNFATFKSEAEGNLYKEATGKKGELIQDPLSKEWFIEPELEGFEDLGWEDGMESLTSERRNRLSDETLDYGEMSKDGAMDLFSIFNNEKGAVDVTPLRIAVDKIEQVVEASKKAGKSIDEFLDMIGMSPESIAQFKIALAQMPKDKETLRELDPITERILNPTGPIVHQTVKMNKMGEVKSVLPPITQALSSKIMNATRDNIWGNLNVKVDPKSSREMANISTGNIQRYLHATETRINAFRRFGIPEIYRDWRALKTKKELEYKTLGDEIKLKRDSLTKKEREDLAIAAYADMKGGEEAFTNMGINLADIPTMNIKQMEVFNWMTKTTSKMLDRVNYIRVHTGQKPIPRLLDKNGKENYLPLMRQMNVLREMGVLDGITTTDARRISSISSDYHGIFNPHAKSRKVSDIPIDLDVFKAMESYLNYTLEEIYIGPLAAQVKELATVPLPKPDGKGSTILKNHNPALSQLLLKWSDEIMGIDRTSSIMAIENPFIRNVAQQLSKNIVVGIIGGNLQTFLKQPTALIGVYANIGLPSSLYGAARYMIEKPFKGSKSEAQTLSNSLHIRKAELIWSDFIEQMKMGTLKGGKAIATKVAFAPMDLIDSAVAEIGWNAGFSYAKGKLKLGEKDAIDYADDLVERTQGMGTRGAVSPIQASIATKWLTLLQTFGIADFNYILQDIGGIKNPDVTKSQQLSRAFRYILGAMVIGEMFKTAGLNSPFPTPVDAFVESREEGKGIPSATFNAMMEFTEKLPVWGGSAKYGSSLGGVIGEFAQDVPEAAKAVNDLMDWGSMTQRQKLNASMLIAKSIGYAWGIPMTNPILKGVKTASRGGDPYQIILGIYIDERKKKGGAPNFKLESPSLKLPKGL